MYKARLCFFLFFSLFFFFFFVNFVSFSREDVRRISIQSPRNPSDRCAIVTADFRSWRAIDRSIDLERPRDAAARESRSGFSSDNYFSDFSFTRIRREVRKYKLEGTNRSAVNTETFVTLFHLLSSNDRNSHQRQCIFVSLFIYPTGTVIQRRER